MAHCFSVVDNFDGKFVKAIIELPFTGEFVTDGWLPSILVNLHGSHEQLKKSLKFALRIIERSDTCHQFSLFSSKYAWLLSQDTQPNVWTNLLPNFRTWIALREGTFFLGGERAGEFWFFFPKKVLALPCVLIKKFLTPPPLGDWQKCDPPLTIAFALCALVFLFWNSF